MFAGCNHIWEVKDKTILPSGYEQLGDGTDFGSRSIPQWMFKKKVIVILACKKCGRLDKTTEENF